MGGKKVCSHNLLVCSHNILLCPHNILSCSLNILLLILISLFNNNIHNMPSTKCICKLNKMYTMYYQSTKIRKLLAHDFKWTEMGGLSWGEQLISILLRIVYPMLPVSLDCPLLIVPSVFSNVYLQTRISI
jgi:prepilin signal peptidase PulO-like enzyme (type II secretory pathway)